GMHRRRLLQRSGLRRQPRHGGVADDRIPWRLCVLLRPGRPAWNQDRSPADQSRGGRARACPCGSRDPGASAVTRGPTKMAERPKPVDVVRVGVGMTGAIMGKELAATGLKVVGLERGPARDTVPDFQSPAIHDELRFAVRKALMQDNVKETQTFRNS